MSQQPLKSAQAAPWFGRNFTKVFYDPKICSRDADPGDLVSLHTVWLPGSQDSVDYLNQESIEGLGPDYGVHRDEYWNLRLEDGTLSAIPQTILTPEGPIRAWELQWGWVIKT